MQKDSGDLPDVERSSKMIIEEDPFAFKNGLKSDGELSELRKRKRGKRLVQYHSRQNAVRPPTPSVFP